MQHHPITPWDKQSESSGKFQAISVDRADRQGAAASVLTAAIEDNYIATIWQRPTFSPNFFVRSTRCRRNPD
jgi:hypothetical protein